MKTIMTLVGVVIAGHVLACDFCGCFMGITPYDNQSSIALLYRYKMYSGYDRTGQSHYLFHRNFTSYSTQSTLVKPGNYNAYKHGSMGSGEPVHNQYLQSDYELYTSVELRAKYFIHPKLELNLIAPVQMNEQRTGAYTEHISGFGDITLMAVYHLVEHTLTERVQQRLTVGYGIKLPTAFNMYGESDDFLMQPGTGSTDHLLSANYIVAGKKLGISLNGAYKVNGKNSDQVRVANSETAYLNLFYKFRQAKQLKVFPSVQLYHEYCKGVYVGSIYQPGTAMNNLTGGIGADIFYKQFALDLSWHVPVYEQRYNENMLMAGKFMVGLTFSFNQKNYLLKSKKES